MKKIKFLLATCLAGASLNGMAQTHAEGAEYYRADQFENAKELLLRNMDNPNTDKAISNYYLGLIELKNGNNAEAKKCFDQGVAANAQYAGNYVGLGMLELNKGSQKEAEQYFKDAESYGKKDASVQIAIARAYYEADAAKYAKEIDKRIEKARKLNMKDPDIYLFEGDRLADKKDWGGAGAMYEMAANYDNQTPEAYVKYANLFTMVNPDYAIRMLNQLLQNNPNSALGQREIATAYYNKKDYKNAASQYAQYVANPNHFKQDEDRYAFLLFYGGDYQQGYDYATKLLNENPSNFTAQRYQFMNAAQLPSMKDQILPLAENLYKAHSANANNKLAPIDYTLIAEEFSGSGRRDEAVKVLEEAIKDMPENANFNKQLAMTYVDAGQISSAADAFAGYIEKTEEPSYNDFVQQATFDYYAAIESKADAAKSDAYYADAEKYIEKASAAYPGFYKPIKMKGDIAKQRAAEADVAKAAVPYYTEAIAALEGMDDTSRYANDAKEMYNYMGNYYLDQKDVPTAKKYFNKYLEYDPNNDAYRKFVDGLQ